MPSEGELVVSIAWDGRRVQGVDVRSTRPQMASRVLNGKSPGEAVATARRLFNICADAQGVAAATALGAAGAGEFPAADPGRDRAAAMAMLQDHFWHLLIDWPRAMAVEPEAAAVRDARGLIAESAHMQWFSARSNTAAVHPTLAAALAELAGRTVFGMPPGQWLELPGLAALNAWAARGATLPARLLASMLPADARIGVSTIAAMPAASPENLLRVVAPALRSPAQFARAPTWEGLAVETGAIARQGQQHLVAAFAAQHGQGTGARIVARLAELARLVGECGDTARSSSAMPRVLGVALAEDIGLAAVETARGLLLHRVRIAGQQVAEYCVVAPTEWNFHPQGALAQGLQGLEVGDRDELRRVAKVCIHGLDPCVSSRVEIGHA